MSSCTSNDLALKILEKELELESNYSLPTLNSLVESYRLAIEHFEEVKSSKLYDYQERLQKILMRPQVLQLMQEDYSKHRCEQRIRNRGRAHTETLARPMHRANTDPAFKGKLDLSLSTEPSSPSTPSTPSAPSAPSAPSTQSAPSVPSVSGQIESPNQPKSTLATLAALPSSPTNDKILNRIVESQQKRTEHIIGKAVGDFKAQETSLNERLRNRRQKGNNGNPDTSFNSFQPSGVSLPPSPLSTSKQFSFDVESDKSGGVNVFSILHERIEKIMEESFNEKTEKITEVKVRYGTQMGELEAQGGFFVEIIKQMKISMSQEIEQISQDIDVKRKSLINEAKRELGLINN